MSRTQAFNSPLLLGFEHLERVLDHVSKTPAEGYPPYNIEQVSENGLRISLAVAGFTIDDLSVSIENNQLVIRGKKREDDQNRVFLYRGIASRHFHRTFVLAEGIEVIGAHVDNGLLHIDLERRVPEPAVRSIKITNGERKADGTLSPTRPARTRSDVGEQA